MTQFDRLTQTVAAPDERPILSARLARHHGIRNGVAVLDQGLCVTASGEEAFRKAGTVRRRGQRCARWKSTRVSSHSATSGSICPDPLRHRWTVVLCSLDRRASSEALQPRMIRQRSRR